MGDNNTDTGEEESAPSEAPSINNWDNECVCCGFPVRANENICGWCSENCDTDSEVMHHRFG